MGGCEHDQFPTLSDEKFTASDKKRASARLQDRCEGGIDFGFICGPHDLDLPTETASRCAHILELSLKCRAVRVQQHRDKGRLRKELMQQFKALFVERRSGKTDAGDVPA